MSKITPTPWAEAVENPAPGEHVVQMYRDPELLVNVVARWCEQGLVRGEAALVIATPAHRAAFAQRLIALGTDVGTCMRRRQYVDVDAHECLETFMIGGAPDHARFHAAITSHLD